MLLHVFIRSLKKHGTSGSDVIEKRPPVQSKYWLYVLTCRGGLNGHNKESGLYLAVQTAFLSDLMIVLVFFSALSAVSVNADLFHFDSISNVSSYYFNYLYCHVWEGECQPNHEDATQQGRSWGAEESCLTPGALTYSCVNNNTAFILSNTVLP